VDPKRKGIIDVLHLAMRYPFAGGLSLTPPRPRHVRAARELAAEYFGAAGQLGTVAAATRG